MTETAKQDTSKASSGAAPAQASETAAAPAVSAAPQGDAGRQAPEPADSGSAHDEGADADLDETKRKFRAALERKQQARTEAQGKGGRDGAKINGAHGPAASRRSFRRKSG